MRQVIVDPAKVFYDSNVQPHQHFYNVDDGSLVDVDSLDLPLAELPRPPNGTAIHTIDIVIRVTNISPDAQQ